MKIIQLIYSLTSGGAERFVVSLSNQLSKMGHDVTVCVLLSNEIKYTFNKQFLHPNVRYHSLGFSPGFTIRKVLSTEKYILQQKPDVVHCHLNVIPYIYKLALNTSNIKFIHTLHSVAENALGLSIQYPINKYFYRKGNIVPVTISPQCQNSYALFYKLPVPVYIDNGCESSQLTLNHQSVQEEVKSYKTTENTSVFVHVARYHYQKNQILLIKAFNHLIDLGYDACLLVIGDGFDTFEGNTLKQIACDRIHFLGLKSNVGDYLHCADAFCLSSIYEGLPISLLEALSCGVIPICTKVGGILDVIEDGKTGILSADDVESYANALQRFFTCGIDKDTLKLYYQSKYSMEACAKKYLSLYGFHRNK